MSESDGRLAPVTYLPGVPRPPEAEPAAGAMAAAGQSAAEQRSAGTAATEPAGARSPEGVSRDSTSAVRSGVPASRRSPAHPAGRRLPTLRSVYGVADDGDDEDDDESAAWNPAEEYGGEYYRGGDDTSCADLEDAALAAAAGRSGVGARADDRADDDAESGASARTPADRVENISMHALSRRGLSRRELEKTLRSREVDEASIVDELVRLESVGLIDDLALAQNLVGVLQERKGLGRTGVAAELARRMLSPAAIAYALELVDSGDETARARELAVARARQLTRLDRETAVRRLSAYLARRGYGGSTVRAAVEAALGTPKAGATVRFR